MRQNKNTLFYIDGSGLDQTDYFQKFCGSGLDTVSSDQDWTRTEKIHSPLIPASHSLSFTAMLQVTNE